MHRPAFLKSRVAGLGLAALLLMPLSASAVTMVTVKSVNLRAGPATGFPVVVTMPATVHVQTYGCLADMSWCDVGWAGQRGWVAGAYIRTPAPTGTVIVSTTTPAVVGVTVVTFDYAYWQRYYVGRPWYGSWAVYAPYAPRGVVVVRPPVVRGPGPVVGGCGPRGCVVAHPNPRPVVVRPVGPGPGPGAVVIRR